MLSLAKEGSEMVPGNPSFGGSLGDSDATAKTAYGHLTAIDPVSGKIHWRYRDNFPMVGGALSTAGDLVFTGTPASPARKRRNAEVAAGRAGSRWRSNSIQHAAT